MLRVNVFFVHCKSAEPMLTVRIAIFQASILTVLLYPIQKPEKVDERYRKTRGTVPKILYTKHIPPFRHVRLAPQVTTRDSDIQAKSPSGAIIGISPKVPLSWQNEHCSTSRLSNNYSCSTTSAMRLFPDISNALTQRTLPVPPDSLSSDLGDCRAPVETCIESVKGSARNGPVTQRVE